MPGSQLYSDQVTTSSGSVVFANLVTTSAQTTAINNAISGITPDQQVSTSLYTGAVSGTPTNATAANVTVGTITTINSVANKLCTMYIPVSITPTATNTQVQALIQLTGNALNSVLVVAFEYLRTGTDAVIMRDVATTSTAGQLQLTFGPNATTSVPHTGVIKLVAVHA